MGAENAVDLAINVETEKALKSIEKFGEQATQSTSGVEKAFGALKTVAIAAVAVFAGKQVLDFFSSGIDAANAQQQAVAQLGQQLQLTGEYSTEALDSFAAFADEMEKTSKFGDDVVLSQIAVAKSFGVSNEQAQKLVKGAIELSAATGDNLESSVKKLGLTFSGVTGKLDEQIPALKGLSKQALASGEAIDVVLKRFGGSAESEINTFAGATLQADNAFGNLAEAFGKIIIENPALVTAVKGVTEILGELQLIVEDNQDAIGDGLTGAIKVVGVTLSATVDVVAFFIRGMQGLVNIVNLAQAGFTELVSLVALIPGVPDDVTESVNALRDSTYEMAANTAEGFDQFNTGIENFSAKVDGAVQKIFDADNKIAASGKKANQARSDSAKGAAADLKELEKLETDRAKLIAELTQGSLDEIGKISVKYREQLDSINKLFGESSAKGNELRLQAEQNLLTQIGAIRDKENQAAIEATKKAAEEQRKAVEEQAASPIAFLVKKVEIDSGAMSQFSTEVSLGLGTLNKALGGKDGAKAMVADAAGAIGDAFMPGIGGAVGGIVSKLAEGPEATKEFIKGFVEGMPDIITAVAESMPVVVESLVDTLINEGGLVKIAIALGKAMLGVEIFKSVGKQLGLDMGASFDPAKLGRILGDSLKQVLPDFAGMGRALADSFTAPVRQLFQGDIKGALMSAFLAPLEIIKTTLPASIREPFESFINKIREQFSRLFSFKLPSIPTPKWLEPFIDAIRTLTNFSMPGTNIGGGGGGAVSKAIGVNVGFAEGGVIPSGFPNDSFPARLTSGERILRPDDSDTLSSMLRAFEGGSLGGNDAMLTLLARILAAVESPITVVDTKVDFKGQTLANMMLQLSRQNARTA